MANSITRTLETITLNIIVPVHNEQNSVMPFLNALQPIMKQLSCKTNVVFIDDGSTDQTVAMLKKAKTDNASIKIICLTRNFGKEAALTAGLEYGGADIYIPIDVDLQDPPEMIIKMIEQWQLGYDHVVAVRQSRQCDSWMKRASAEYFYRIFNRLSELKIPKNAGDFRLLSQARVDQLLKLREKNRFMKGLYAWVGGKTAVVYFERQSRTNDQSSFNLQRLFRFSLDALTAFTTAPLRLWSFLGLLICLASGLYGSFIVIKTVFFGIATPGYASLITVILFLGGIQLLSLGIIGEYLSRLFIEVKGRPIYLIDEIDD